MQSRSKKTWSPRLVSVLISLAVFSVVASLRQAGSLQYLEFRAYDQFLRWHNQLSASDSPVVIVGISERDIHDPALGSWPIADDKLAKLLNALDAQGPRVIGMEMLRDMPVPVSGEKYEALRKVLLEHPHIVCIWKFGDAQSVAVPPSSALKPLPERVGFSDFPVDQQIDGAVRRGLLYVDDGTTLYESFALQIALIYMEPLGIKPVSDPFNPKWLRLGKAKFRPLEKNDGAYVDADAGGYQVLLDFRGPRQFTTFSGRQAMTGGIPKDALRDKIVILGVTAVSVKDDFLTPLKKNHRGIEVQAHWVDQLLRAAQQGQQPLAVLGPWQALAGILVWCLTGGAIGLFVRSPVRFCLAMTACVLILLASSWLAFLMGRWGPGVPSFLARDWKGKRLNSSHILFSLFPF